MPTTPVLVICALDSEAVHLRRDLDAPDERDMHGWRLTRGNLGDAVVDLVICDIGMVPAAAATTAALSANRYRAVLNYGCAGAHRDDINCGDVIIGEQSINLGSFIVGPSDGGRRPFGFDDATGTVPGIESDPDLLQRATEISDANTLPPWPGLNDPPAVHRGSVGSADVWTQHPETIHWLHRTYGTLCEDMEAAAIAQVCEHFGVPFLTVKDISNNELAATSELNPEFGLLAPVEEEVGRRAGLLVSRLIAGLTA